LLKPQNRSASGGFTTTGLTDDPEGLTRKDFETDVINSTHRRWVTLEPTARQREVLNQSLHFEEGLFAVVDIFDVVSI
jgi:hypothetical protein